MTMILVQQQYVWYGCVWQWVIPWYPCFMATFRLDDDEPVDLSGFWAKFLGHQQGSEMLRCMNRRLQRCLCMNLECWTLWEAAIKYNKVHCIEISIISLYIWAYMAWGVLKMGYPPHKFCQELHVILPAERRELQWAFDPTRHPGAHGRD